MSDFYEGSRLDRRANTYTAQQSAGDIHRPDKMAATAAARIVGNAALGARIEIRNTLNVPLYIDWLAAQLWLYGGKPRSGGDGIYSCC